MVGDVARPTRLTIGMGDAARGEAERAAAETDFDRVFAEFGPALRRIAASYEPDAGRRDDLFQEIALALWRALPRFRRECSLRTFVFRIAHNRALTHVWQRGRSRTHDMSAAVHVADPSEGPERETARRHQRERLDAAIRALPVVHRQVLMLALEDLSHAEMAAVLGISENAVAVRLTRARQALREALGVIS
jgi:RNA polymerase sigma-70 factor (ECF subfamily)